MTKTMKNIKFLLVLAISVIFVSCSQEKAPETADTISTKSSAASVTPESPVKPYENPVFIYGSSFGEYFQMLYKTGKFEEMAKFTSSESIDKFGRDNVIGFYKSMDFAYKINLMSKNEDAGVVTLNYEADIMATKHILRMDIVLENDSCKILLKNLESIK